MQGEMEKYNFLKKQQNILENGGLIILYYLIIFVD